MIGNVKYLFSNLGRIEKALTGKYICLFLDYDGTLAPVAETPDKARLGIKTKGLLGRLSRMPDCKIAIVSGRSLKDIAKRVGLRNVIYVGNHGHEIKGPNISFKSPLPVGYRKTLKEIKARLREHISHICGVLIEDKGLSLSVHYRLVGKKWIPAVESEFNTVLFAHELNNEVHIKRGKMVLEVVPPVLWNKGKAVLRLLEHYRFTMCNKGLKALPIYIGDDKTDEDAFESLKGKGVTIFVGKPKKTKAEFYVKDTGQVVKFLELMIKIMR